jgi:hypothetical protein
LREKEWVWSGRRIGKVVAARDGRQICKAEIGRRRGVERGERRWFGGFRSCAGRLAGAKGMGGEGV